MKYRPVARLRPPLIGVAVVKTGNRWRSGESCAFSQDFSLSFAKAESGRSAQPASALFIVLSAVMKLEIVGTLEGREGERLSRVGPSAKAALTGNAQSRARPYRTSLSDYPGWKVAGARTP